MVSYFFIVPSYLIWHYGEAQKDFFRVWTNFLWFLSEFFSITLLLKTLFAPLKRIHEGRSKAGFHMEDFAEAFVANTAMRFIGFLMRTIIIICGVSSLIIFFWLGILSYLVWIVLPLLIPVSFFYGVSVFFI